MIILTAKSISKSFGANPILTELSCELHANSRVGIVGSNGSGKTTLCSLLVGNDTPDNGDIFRAKDKTFTYLPQNLF